jgi:hypothetical protein
MTKLEFAMLVRAAAIFAGHFCLLLPLGCLRLAARHMVRSPISWQYQLNRDRLQHSSAACTQVLLGTLLLIAQTWLLALCVWPAAAFCAYKIATSTEGPVGLAKPFEPARLYDDTTIFNDLAKYKQELFIKLGLYMLAFFGVLYHMLRVTIYFVLPYTKNALMNTFLRPFSSTKKT